VRCATAGPMCDLLVPTCDVACDVLFDARQSCRSHHVERRTPHVAPDD